MGYSQAGAKTASSIVQQYEKDYKKVAGCAKSGNRVEENEVGLVVCIRERRPHEHMTERIDRIHRLCEIQKGDQRAMKPATATIAATAMLTLSCDAAPGKGEGVVDPPGVRDTDGATVPLEPALEATESEVGATEVELAMGVGVGVPDLVMVFTR